LLGCAAVPPALEEDTDGSNEAEEGEGKEEGEGAEEAPGGNVIV
jgi:hypothetical protein